MQITKKAGIGAATEICQVGYRENSRGGYEVSSTPISRVFVAKVEIPLMSLMKNGGLLPSTPDSSKRARFDGHKKRKGSKVHAAMDTLGYLLALKVTAAANEQDRAEVGELAKSCEKPLGEGGDCVRGSMLNRRAVGGGCGPARHWLGSGQTSRSQERIYAVAAPLGG